MAIEDDVRAARQLLDDHPPARAVLQTMGISEDEYVFMVLAQKYGQPQIRLSTTSTGPLPAVVHPVPSYPPVGGDSLDAPEWTKRLRIWYTPQNAAAPAIPVSYGPHDWRRGNNISYE